MPVLQYKRAEKEVAGRIASWFRRAGVSAVSFFRDVMKMGRERFTVSLIPHSQKKIVNFQISFFALVFGAFTFGIIMVGSLLLAAHYPLVNELNARLLRERDAKAQAVTSLRDGIVSLRTAGKQLKRSIDGVRSTTRSDFSVAGESLVAASFQSFPDAAFPAADGTRELSDLKTLTNLLASSSGSIDRVAKVLTVFRDLMANAPTTWPLKGAAGVITTRFGWTTNPFTRQGYMHTGVDIAWGLGTPIVATADGTILLTGYTDDLGNFVMIQHKYGYSTRYSHLSGFADKRTGARVSRGEVIGYLGNTGLSTGPHLDYVVRLGSSYINPMQFLSIRPENTPALAVNHWSSD